MRTSDGTGVAWRRWRKLLAARGYVLANNGVLLSARDDHYRYNNLGISTDDGPTLAWC